MHGKDFFINDGGDRQTIKAICECLPKLDIVPSFALVVKSINAVDAGTFVIAAQDEEVFWVLDFIGEQETDCL